MSRVIVLAVVLVFAAFPLLCGAKPIRLRNEVFHPKQKESAASKAALKKSDRTTGLFLVQFRSVPGETEKLTLEKLGVELLQFVPEDTFICRFKQVDMPLLEAHPLIEWVGSYRPEHKMHASLHARSGLAIGKNKAEEDRGEEVTVIVARGTEAQSLGELRSGFARIRQEGRSRAGTIFKGRLHPNRLKQLSESDNVLWVEPRRDMKLWDEVSSKLVAGDGGPQQLLTRSFGFDGSGVTIAVADSGLNNGDAETMHPDLFGRTTAFFQYGTLEDASDEHGHGTHVAGIVAGNGALGETDENGNLYGLGVAPGANIIGQRLFDGTGEYYPPPSFEVMTHDATRSGAEIGSNSWGDDTQGRYDVSAMEFDELVRDADFDLPGSQQYILEFSAGNAGPSPQTIGSPAVAKNVIATGAAQNDRPDLYIYDAGPDAMADFSSRGPAEDGRIKPDVVAPGTWIASLQSGSATDQYAWGPISANYQYQGGTSQAGPHASGAAAVFVQWYRTTQTNTTPSPALVKAALINSAVDMDDSVETGPAPNMDEGWGRIDLTPFLDSERAFHFEDQAVALTNGQVYEKRILIAGAEFPLKVTLTYTDVPGFPGSARALVNDLDLEVLAPNGDVYRGNQFVEGESVPNALATDDINNVEGVLLWTPDPGEYVVRVRGRRIVSDARNDQPGVNQDFALVISGRVPVPGTGTILLNKREYRAADTIEVKLYDSNNTNQSRVQILARSATEPAGEPLTLNATSTGVFAGSIGAVSGAAAADGKLQLSHDDWIEFRYMDADPAGLRVATAWADFLPPAVVHTGTETEFSRVWINFQTDELARGIVWFGPNPGSLQPITNYFYEVDHTVGLPRLNEGQTYYYQLVAVDEAGNGATNNNNGAFYTVIAPSARTAILVDAATSSDFDNDIPLTVYTDALQQIGVTFDVWNSSEMGRSPGTNDLAPYRLLIWRVSDGVGTTDTLSPLDQSVIRDHLRNGGSFFMASMEQLTRLGSGTFRSNILHVASFMEDVGVDTVYGIPNNSLTSGLEIPLNFSAHQNEWHELLGVPDDISDVMVPTSDAAPILLDSFGDAVGIQYPRTGQDGVGRVVFLSFPLEAVPTSGTGGNTRNGLLQSLVAFLVPGAGGQGTLTMDSASYTVPARVVLELGDSSLAGRSNATVQVSTTTQPAGMSLVLTETHIAGLFRGSFDLVEANASSGQLRAVHGDQLKATYLDESLSRTIQTVAQIDTQHPAISGVTVTVDYESATISWHTDELSDSTVQFGESAFLGRSSGDTFLTTAHEITLSQLTPDRTYYFKVVSRDNAGNPIEDDNAGKLYTFQTLKPLLPPWFDHLDTGATNWSVSSSDDSQMSWRLGPPNNELGQNNAPSQPNAWGSNLDGEPIDYAETFLISPAIQLTNGNTALLRFKHNYDFTERTAFDIIETGQLLIVLPGAGSTVPLAEFGFDLSGDWIEEEIDLTPYMGKVVYLVWFYQVLSVETANRPGWLLDDVSVETSSVVPGSITITNNLWQSGYVLSGPLFKRGTGVGERITNAPPGTYTLSFNPVPFYQAPPSQTNELVQGGTLQFKGEYQFQDTNSNGVADAWENFFFGTGSTNSPAVWDTDGDGMTDLSEFLAGTDPLSPPRPFPVQVHTTEKGIASLVWPSRAGKEYRLLYSTNLTHWSTYVDWQKATTNAMTFALPLQGLDPVFYVRVEANTEPKPGDPPGLLQLSREDLPDGGVRLSWPSSPGRGYMLEKSTNGNDWTSASPWIRAAAVTTTYTIPAGQAGSSMQFRIQVHP